MDAHGKGATVISMNLPRHDRRPENAFEALLKIILQAIVGCLFGAALFGSTYLLWFTIKLFFK
jgi:hypothetical protein